MTVMPDEIDTQPPPTLDELMQAAAERTWNGAGSLEAYAREYAARWRGALAREAGIGHFPEARS